MSTRIELEGGKYTLLHEDGTNLRCLRYGEAWRDLVGDGMVLALVDELEALHDRCRELEERLAKQL